MTPLEKVILNSKDFDAPKRDKLVKLSESHIAKFRISLLQEELDELKEAIADDNMTEVRDALADLKYVLLGTVEAFDLSNVHDRDFDDVHESNQSKKCLTENEAAMTVLMYKNGTHPDKVGVPIESYYKKIGNHWIVMKADNSKYLKSVRYFSPKFVELD